MKSFNESLDQEMAKKKQLEKKDKYKLEMPFKRFDKSLPALFREDKGNAGFDLFARLDEPVFLEPGEVTVIPLNVATQIPAFAVGLLFQRSSTYRKWKVRLTNGVGVVDSLFQGSNDEWGAEFQNMSDTTTVINNGDKLCQAVFLSLLPVEPVEKDDFNTADRGGFGTSFDRAEDLGEL
ncbi:dUTP diphosphatase [Solibacillus silvestris]